MTPDSLETFIVGNDGLVISTKPFPIPIGIDPEIHRSFSVYPNPNQGRFYIKNPFNRPQDAISRIYDLQGRLVHEQPIAFISEPQQVIDTQGLQEGIYILHMIAEGEAFSPQKLILRPRP